MDLGRHVPFVYQVDDGCESLQAIGGSSNSRSTNRAKGIGKVNCDGNVSWMRIEMSTNAMDGDLITLSGT